MNALLELAINLRTDLPNLDLSDLAFPYFQSQLLGAAIADEPERLAEYLEDVSYNFRKHIGKLLMQADLTMAMTILVEQMKDSPQFRDLLSEVQDKADEAIEQTKRDRFKPEGFKADLVERHGEGVSFK